MNGDFTNLIEMDSLELRFLHVCGARAFAPGWVHEKTVPHGIIAQAIQGSYEITCQGKTARVTAPEAFLTPANAPMRIIHHGAQGGFQARWVHFAFTLYRSMDVTNLLEMPLILPAEEGRVIGEVIDALTEPSPPEADLRSTLHAAALQQELAWRILGTLCRVSRLKPHASERLADLARMRPLLEYLRENLDQPLDVPRMARLAGLSVSRFHAVFRERMGVSPMNYLKQRRLEEAALLMVQGQLSVKEIAAATGFAGTSHLSREFKRHFAQSPSAYRQITGAGAGNHP